MLKTRYLACFVSVFCGQVLSGVQDTQLIAAVDARFSAANAYATVAYVESRWRVVGNTGYNESIFYVRDLLQQAGFVAEDLAPEGQRFTYRLTRQPMSRPAWEPVAGALWLEGETEPLMTLADNRNMIAIHSPGTLGQGIEADLVYVGNGPGGGFEGKQLAGCIAFGEGNLAMLYQRAVTQGKALGVIAYNMPAYTQPQRHIDSIQFSSIPYRAENQGFALLASYRVKQRLTAALAKHDNPRLRVALTTRMFAAQELTLIAEIAGSSHGEERFVYSAHVQEPGANDNASGVAVLAEVARIAAGLISENKVPSRRSLTFIWGDEIAATRRYIAENPARAKDIKWGMSLDMVGQDTTKTGGSFLIEKMPDPSAVWTRGADRHTEWGGRPLGLDEMQPHYFNDFVINRFRAVARGTDWAVATNPYEGGSDHVPFLNAGIPGLLVWHFTDVFYHTDRDRLDKVSKTTMQRVGVGALVTALCLSSADEKVAMATIAELVLAAEKRLSAEAKLGKTALTTGASAEQQLSILNAWRDWYVAALRSITQMPVGGASAQLADRVEAACEGIGAIARRYSDEFASRQ